MAKDTENKKIDSIKASDDKSLATAHDKWQRESEAIRKVQISLDFPDAADVLLRTLAAREHKAPSAMIREIIGMPSSPPKRARIGVSFNEAELLELGERYGVNPNDKAEIRRQLTAEVTSVLSSADAPNSIPEVKESKNSKLELTSAAMKDLQAASDNIHQRFVDALEERTNKRQK